MLDILSHLEQCRIDRGKGLRCPSCKTELQWSEEQLRYETTCEHVEDPNGESPLRTYLFCPNELCELYEHAFWDADGGYYDKDGSGGDWYRNNSRDSYRPETHRRKGCSALGSLSRKFEDGCIKAEYYWWRRLRRRLRTRFGNWGVHLRNKHSVTLYEPRLEWWSPLALMLGVWIMDPLGIRYRWYIERNKAFGSDIRVLGQWRWHPYPWVRWRIKQFLQQACKDHNWKPRYIDAWGKEPKLHHHFCSECLETTYAESLPTGAL